MISTMKLEMSDGETDSWQGSIGYLMIVVLALARLCHLDRIPPTWTRNPLTTPPRYPSDTRAMQCDAVRRGAMLWPVGNHVFVIQ